MLASWFAPEMQRIIKVSAFLQDSGFSQPPHLQKIPFSDFRKNLVQVKADLSRIIAEHVDFLCVKSRCKNMLASNLFEQIFVCVDNPADVWD
ncbi:hypothetical protein CEXT_158091 [Caerostris extrusa]|uniref:Uncharacterized protein n=1 Tax=Caerostris extrusa TaxID=172846 RepID=A0AAV4XWK4_CAEEX|nr:hypothetical protein CEXT_158091 [Caerostris extrusa]